MKVVSDKCSNLSVVSGVKPKSIRRKIVVKVALLVRLVAKPGKEAEVEK